MIQAQLHAAVADATGDSLATIRRLGFQSNRRPPQSEHEPHEPLAVIDCPCCGGVVLLAASGSELPVLAECRRCETEFGYFPDEVYEADLDAIASHEPRAFLLAA